MQAVDEKETIHIYVTREEIISSPSRFPLVLPLILSLLALFAIVAAGILFPYQPPQVREVIRVPAIFLPLRAFHASVKVIATGRVNYPAVGAHGLLTITNGSILSQELPAGMIFAGSNGGEVVTDSAVFVPAGSAAGYGYARVPAHAAVPGTRGNIPALAINQVLGTALYIRNLHAFIGGKDATSSIFITPSDKRNALQQARTKLTASIYAGILSQPCKEAIAGSTVISVRWTCQYITYHVPAYMRVVGVRVSGHYFYLDIVFVAHQNRFYSK